MLLVIVNLVVSTVGNHFYSGLVGEAAAGGGAAGDWLGASAASALLAPILALATVVIAYELIGLKGRGRG